MKMGFMVAFGHAGWLASLGVEGICWRNLEGDMECCDLARVLSYGLAASHTLMYSEAGIVLSTLPVGGETFNYRDAAFAHRQRLKAT